MTIDNTYLFDRNVRPEDLRQMYSSHVLRSKWNWQLSRELSARVIAQYDGLTADPRFTSTSTGRSVNGDFLLTYLMHPGTALYIGYNTNFSRPGPPTGSNPDEFFAELTMWYFGTHGDLHMSGSKPENGPDGLKKYDPDAFALLDDFYSGRVNVKERKP